MNVSVFGLGYVGSVSAASFAADGHDVVGVDVNADKVRQRQRGPQPDRRAGPRRADRARRGATAACARRPTPPRRSRDSDVSLICVGTPSRKNGSLDLDVPRARVASRSARRSRDKAGYHVVVVRSTVLPGTTHDVVIPALERASGKKYGDGFGVVGQPGVPARGHGAQGLPARRR